MFGYSSQTIDSLIYNAISPSPAAGSTVPLQADSHGNLQVNLNSYISGEDPVRNLMNTDGAAKQGPINIVTAAATTGGTTPTTTGTCSASADNLVTFASAVRTIELHNQSAVNVPYEHDLVAAVTSTFLAPGQLLYIDVHTLSLHIFPSNALPINAANGLIVRGWA